MTQNDEYYEIEQYLDNKKTMLSFSDDDIEIVETKINEKYLTDSSEDNNQIKKLVRLKKLLEYQVEVEKADINFTTNITIGSIIIGIIITLADPLLRFFMEDCKLNIASSFIFTMLILVVLITIYIALIGALQIKGSFQKNKNRKIAILTIDEMIKDKEVENDR